MALTYRDVRRARRRGLLTVVGLVLSLSGRGGSNKRSRRSPSRSRSADRDDEDNGRRRRRGSFDNGSAPRRGQDRDVATYPKMVRAPPCVVRGSQWAAAYRRTRQ